MDNFLLLHEWRWDAQPCFATVWAEPQLHQLYPVFSLPVLIVFPLIFVVFPEMLAPIPTAAALALTLLFILSSLLNPDIL